MDSGHANLVAKLVARIEREGPITFADFMASALYDPEYGYYMSSDSRIGTDGDVYTSPDVHPIFGALLARQLAQVADAIAAGGEFTIIEQGAGKGSLARHILQAYTRDNPGLLRRTRYVIIERSPAMVQHQRE